jgi:zinc protease
VDAELTRFAAEGPTEPELERARNTHLADFYKGLDHLQTRADLLNHYQHLLGDPDGVARDLERYSRATRESVRAAFARTLAGKRLALRTIPEPVAA